MADHQMLDRLGKELSASRSRGGLKRGGHGSRRGGGAGHRCGFPHKTALAAALDVTDKDAVEGAVKLAQDRFGSIDVLVNNAGYGYRAAVEEGDDREVAALFATNFFGTVSMIKAVLPGMRARRSGTILNVSSIAGRLAAPGSGYYSASKFAIEGLSDALRKEVAPLGIRVTVIEPGAFRTDFAGRSLHQASADIADYASTAGPRRKENDKTHGTQAGDPERAARALVKLVEGSTFHERPSHCHDCPGEQARQRRLRRHQQSARLVGRRNRRRNKPSR
ncbi:MAG: SDR family NAD(P)-dependent oxidoreductase [Ancalomicrobiaceae bacterium]|nr:SDR family NAD(P)-dependent oxidoreductase [Ancalomicrobiaceae bacterium]